MWAVISAIAYKSTWGGGRLLRRPGGVDGHIPLFAHRDAVDQLPQLLVGDVLQGEDAADLLRDLRLQIPGRVPRQPVQILPEAGAPLRQEPQPPAQFLHGEQIAGVEIQIAGTLALQLVQTAPESGGRVLRRPGGAGVQPEAYRLRQRGGGGDLGGQPGPELVQQPLLREDGAVAAAAASIVAVDGAVPVDILPPGGVGHPAAGEGAAAALAADEGREGVAAAVSGGRGGAGLPPTLLHQPGRLLKGVRGDDGPLRPVVVVVHVRRETLDLAGEEVAHGVFVVDIMTAVDGIFQDAAHPAAVPAGPQFGGRPPLLQSLGDLPAAQALEVEAEDLPHHLRLRRDDPEGEVVQPVVAVDAGGHPPLPGGDVLPELHPLGQVGALLLGDGRHDGDDEFRFPQHLEGVVDKDALDAQGLQPADALQGVHGVPGEAGDVLDHHQLELPPLRVPEHLEEAVPLFQPLA